jgi:hypothetical protein
VFLSTAPTDLYYCNGDYGLGFDEAGVEYCEASFYQWAVCYGG